MKKFFYLAMLIMSIFLLTSCGSKQADLSGSYFYAQTVGLNGVVAVHQVVISKTDKTNMSYKVKELGMYGINDNGKLDGTLDVDGDLMNLSLPQPSQELDEVTYGGVGYDISQLVGQKFTFKDDVITIVGEGSQKLELYKDSTDMGQKYIEIYTGRSSIEKENTESDSEDDFEDEESISEKKESEEVTFSDLTYNSDDGTISVKVKNNTDYFVDSVKIFGTLDEHETNGYGEDETTEVKFDTSIGGYDISAISDDTYLVIHHIEKGEEKDFTFKLDVGENASKYSDPQIDTSQTKITYRGKKDTGYDSDSTPIYQALDSDYEMELIKNANGDIEGLTITNTSDYQWEILQVNYEHSQRYGDALEFGSAIQYQIEKGATVTIDNLGGVTPNFGYVTRILYVTFEPRVNHE